MERLVPSGMLRKYVEDAHELSSTFEEGDKVECLYKGKGTKWFSGKVTRVNRDDSYDIKYDDGDIESGALQSSIRKHPDAPMKSSCGDSTLCEGMKVEARYRGKAKYYPGTIKRDNRDGTFNLDYVDVSLERISSVVFR
jgi:hypothetical protein